MAASTRHSGEVLDADIVLPMMDKFSHRGKLPTIKSVIGVLRSMTGEGKKQVAHAIAVKEVVKLVYSKWYHDTVCCISMRSMERKLSELWKDFREGKKRLGGGRENCKAVDKYKNLVEAKDKLWDVYPPDEKRRRESVSRSGVSPWVSMSTGTMRISKAQGSMTVIRV